MGRGSAGAMAARAGAARLGGGGGLPAWALGLLPLAVIAAALGAFALLGGPGLGERSGPPVEEVTVERTVLRPGTIELTLRNDGPDPVAVAQVAVNDAFVPFTADGGREIGRLGATTLQISYPWVEGEAYEIFVLTGAGGTIDASIPVAVETPATDLSFYGLMALLGVYVGIIPVSLGMLWLPFMRRLGERWIGALIAFTVGLLGFLAIDAAIEGLEIAAAAPAAFGAVSLLIAGGLAAYLALAAVDAWLETRTRRAGDRSPQTRARGAGDRSPLVAHTATKGERPPAPLVAGPYLALLVAIGIGLHNLGEGLAIGTAYATGALALGAFLVVGFAIHNTTEGLAIVAPLRGGERGGGAVRGGGGPPGGAAARRGALGPARLLGLGLLAGGPAILGAWIGAAAFDPTVAALLFGVGVGAIVRVIVQIAPSMRDSGGRLLHPLSVGGILLGIALLYATGLLVAV